jgi:hypothetical protein
MADELDLEVASAIHSANSSVQEMIKRLETLLEGATGYDYILVPVVDLMDFKDLMTVENRLVAKLYEAFANLEDDITALRKTKRST